MLHYNQEKFMLLIPVIKKDNLYKYIFLSNVVIKAALIFNINNIYIISEPYYNTFID